MKIFQVQVGLWEVTGFKLENTLKLAIFDLNKLSGFIGFGIRHIQTFQVEVFKVCLNPTYILLSSSIFEEDFRDQKLLLFESCHVQ